ncbi:MAG: hypothetical protein OXC91_09815 [Rhodobacteraceae bacterium]|nr:hypothetical protein [Paracoccaceae bacterium]
MGDLSVIAGIKASGDIAWAITASWQPSMITRRRSLSRVSAIGVISTESKPQESHYAFMKIFAMQSFRCSDDVRAGLADCAGFPACAGCSS